MITSQQETYSWPRSMFDSFVYVSRGKQPSLRPHITGNILATLAVFIAIAFVLVACNGSGANDLRGTAWKLASMSGSGLLPGTSITIEFTDQEVSGSAGCNHFGGSYQISGSSLTISDVFWMPGATRDP